VAEPVDALLLVPFEPATASYIDPPFRQTSGAFLNMPLSRAVGSFQAYVGRSLDFWTPSNRPVFDGERMSFPRHRSATAIVLSSSLERAGLRWNTIDPGVQELKYWRQALERYVRCPPRTVAISTTFVMSGPWLRNLCFIIRRTLPQSKVLVGGYYYATNTRSFLSLDADVLCVGEGEVRFPEIVKKIRDGDGLEAVPGLYIRGEDGGLAYTGVAHPLPFASLERPDWSLAERIDPPIDLARDAIEFGVETQRGCLFQCEFCTYRTLTSSAMMDPDQAVSAICDTALAPGGYINMADATASSPHKRWREVLTRLAERGGSPHPIWAFARVSDIQGDVALLMHRAGVRHVFVGQESGDQRMLDAMRKGTRITQVRPAIEALARAGVSATFGFFHGFPGETEESIQATRNLIATLNEPFPSRSVVMTYLLYPFIYMDFAAVSRNEAVAGTSHYLGYSQAPMPPERTVEEALRTIITVSRNPAAPPYAFLFESSPATSGIGLFSRPYKYEAFRWLKAVERGVVIFLERDVDGTRPDWRELRRLRAQVLERYPPTPWLSRQRGRLGGAVNRQVAGRFAHEWSREREHGVGALTRAYHASAAQGDTGSPRLAARAARQSTYLGSDGIKSHEFEHAGQNIDDFAAQLIQQAIDRPRRRVKKPPPGGEPREQPLTIPADNA
jgi:hypothetical protein